MPTLFPSYVGSSPVVAAYVGSSGVAGSEPTFVNIGTADFGASTTSLVSTVSGVREGNLIVACVQSITVGDPSSVTFGGAAATNVEFASSGAPDFFDVVMYACVAPSGADTMNFDVDFGGLRSFARLCTAQYRRGVTSADPVASQWTYTSQTALSDEDNQIVFNAVNVPEQSLQVVVGTPYNLARSLVASGDWNVRRDSAIAGGFSQFIVDRLAPSGNYGDPSDPVAGLSGPDDNLVVFGAFGY